MIVRVVFALAMGSVCGSFAAALADRAPRGESILSGRSRCRGCGRAILLRDLVPIASWMVLRGRCRWCNSWFGSSSLLVEILTAAVFAGCAIVIENPFAVVAYWILSTGLMSLSVIDIFTMRLPRRIIHTTGALGATALAMASVVTEQPERMVTAVVGAAAALVAMMFLYLVSKGRLGDGDVRLSPLLGLFLGWKDLAAVHAGFLVSFVLGSVVGLGLIVLARSHWSRAIPFGPFLATGTMLVVLFDIDLLG